MKKNWVKRLLGGVILGAAMLLSVTALSGVKAEADESVPVTVSFETADGGPVPMIGNFVSTSGEAVISGTTANISLPLMPNVSKLLGSATINNQSAFTTGSDSLNWSMSTSETRVPASFVVTAVHMSPSCYFVVNWGSFNAGSNSSSNSSSSAVVDSSSTSSISNSSSSQTNTSSSSVISNSNSSNNSGSSTTSGKGSSTTSNGSSAASGNNNTNNNTSGSQITNNDKITNLTYEVLQADKKSKSAADQYYTHTAKVEKQSDGTYKITMEVKYAKDSGMTAKGFVPLTANGTKVSDISYGTDGNYYTASFSFNVPSLATLNNLVKGTIHVTVPTMSISSDFDIYYKFTGATTDNTASSNADSTSGDNGADSGYTETSPIGVSATNNNTKKKAATSNGKLPQTNEQQQVLLGVAGLLSLVMVTATAIYRRKMAK